MRVLRNAASAQHHGCARASLLQVELVAIRMFGLGAGLCTDSAEKAS